MSRCGRIVDRQLVSSELSNSGATSEQVHLMLLEAESLPNKVVTYDGMVEVYGAPYAFYMTEDGVFHDNLCLSAEIDRAVQEIKA